MQMFVIEGKNLTLAETDSSRVMATATQAGLPAKVTQWRRNLPADSNWGHSFYLREQFERIDSWVIGGKVVGQGA